MFGIRSKSAHTPATNPKQAMRSLERPRRGYGGLLGVCAFVRFFGLGFSRFGVWASGSGGSRRFVAFVRGPVARGVVRFPTEGGGAGRPSSSPTFGLGPEREGILLYFLQETRPFNLLPNPNPKPYGKPKPQGCRFGLPCQGFGPQFHRNAGRQRGLRLLLGVEGLGLTTCLCQKPPKPGLRLNFLQEHENHHSTALFLFCASGRSTPSRPQQASVLCFRA